MEGSPFLPLPEGMLIDQVQITETGLHIAVVATHPTSRCPLCSKESSSIHSSYRRSVRDVPCGGRQVQLALTVRKVFCRNALCPRKVFTERMPQFVEPWARMTIRHCQALQSIGLATCGKGGARLAARLGMQTSRHTILRRIMDLPDDSAGSVVYVGIDDFGATRSRTCSCKDSRKEDLTWGSAPECPTRLNQVRLGQCSHVRKDGLETVRRRGDC